MNQPPQLGSQISIRRATPADAELLADFGARTFYETFAADNKPEDMTAYLAATFGREKQTDELSRPRNIFFLAAIGAEIAGYAHLRADEAPPECIAAEEAGSVGVAELVRLYVDRRHHGHGVAPALMRQCVETARAELGAEILWLGVWEHNARAQAFYRKWDFQTVGAHYFVLGEDVQTDVLMRRRV